MPTFPEVKLSGISLGGYKRGSTNIFGKKYSLKIIKQNNTYTYSIKKRRFNVPFIVYAIILDIIVYLLTYQWWIFETIWSYISSAGSTILAYALQYIPYSIDIFDMVGDNLSGINSFIFTILPFLILVIGIIVAYYFIYYNLRPWHGAEHKLIAAAENHDIDNSHSYSILHDRCGGTFILTLLVIGYGYMFLISPFLAIPVGSYTIMYGFILFESKYFHHHNHPGIHIGILIQKYLTTSEPDKELVDVGIKGMKELIKLEYG
jgi:uncharacterized protein YqhQ